MPKTKTERAKTIAKFVVGWSTGTVIGKVIASNAAPKNRLQKAEIYVGAFAIGGVVSEQTEAWTDRQIDAVVEAWNKIKDEVKTSTL